MFFTEGLCIRKGLLSFVRKYNNLVISITPITHKLPARNVITKSKIFRIFEGIKKRNKMKKNVFFDGLDGEKGGQSWIVTNHVS